MLLLKKPSAWMPMAISVFLLAVMAYYFMKYGIQHEADEGAGARLFQFLMPIQAVIIVFFVGKNIAWAPRQTLLILALQLFLAFLVVFPVFYFRL